LADITKRTVVYRLASRAASTCLSAKAS
jgi:hypothetical protein